MDKFISEDDRKMTSALGKLKSLFWNLTQEHRIKSEELEDFNSAMSKIWELKDNYNVSVMSLLQQVESQNKAINKQAITEKKLTILCEILGMHDRGISRWLEYPIRFITIINANLRKNNQPIYSETYFEMIEIRWRWLNSMIDRDIQRIESVRQLKEVYGNSVSEGVKIKVAELLKMYHEDIGYIEQDIRMGRDKQQLTEKIINHWYELLSTDRIKCGETGSKN
jgi:hypothetical protein